MSKRQYSILKGAFGAALAAAGVIGLPRSASAADLPNALVITKSSNKNQVNYAVALDGSCTPAGATPVWGYWRMLERGADATEPLKSSELRAFGIAQQSIDAGGVSVVLRGIPGRPITIRTWRAPDGTCASSASTTIAGVPAQISDVYIRQSLFGVAYVQLTGRVATGGVVSERLSP